MLKITYNIETLVAEHACSGTIDEKFKAKIFLDVLDSRVGTDYEEVDLYTLSNDLYTSFLSFERPLVFT